MNIDFDTRQVSVIAAGIRGFSDRRLQSALAEALNNTAREIGDAWKAEIQARIDRPTPMTRNAVRRTRADVGRLWVDISLNRQAPGGGIPPSIYLATQEQGGGRDRKLFELALQRSGAMPNGYRVVPGKYAKLDSFGNISRGQIVQVLNQLAHLDVLTVGYRKVIGRSKAKRAAAAARRGRQYVPILQREGRLHPGIYERKGDLLLPVFFFVSATQYKRRLSLMERGEAVAQAAFGPKVAAAMERRWASLVARNAAGR